MSPASDAAAVAYTYAVARPFDAGRIDGVHGVDGAPVHLIVHRDVVAVVSPLDGSFVTDAALRARLENLDELEIVARAHHAVVEAAANLTVTLPFRLATIHRGEDRVAEILRQGYDHFDAALDRLAGRVELGVKVYALPAEMVPGVAAPEPGSASPGRDYLRRRRDETHRQQDAQQLAETGARRIDESLATTAVERLHHQPQDPRLSTADGANVLNAAYLVEEERVEEFLARAAELQASVAGVAVVVTGPWAPYSFVVRPEEAQR
jgi:hypothetical protein